MYRILIGYTQKKVLKVNAEVEMRRPTTPRNNTCLVCLLAQQENESSSTFLISSLRLVLAPGLRQR